MWPYEPGMGERTTMWPYEPGMNCECLTSDGRWTIGYVDGWAVEWPGNMTPPEYGEHVKEHDETDDPWCDGSGGEYEVRADGRWHCVEP